MVPWQIDFGCVENRHNAVQMIDVPCEGATASRNVHTTPNITISDALTRLQWPDSRPKAESSNKNLKSHPAYSFNLLARHMCRQDTVSRLNPYGSFTNLETISFQTIQNC